MPIELPPLNVTQIGEAPGDRHYVLSSRENVDLAVLGGFLLTIVDMPTLGVPGLGALYLYLARRYLREYRRPLGGIKDCLTNPYEDTVLAAFWDTAGEFVEEMRAANPGAKLSGSDFRRALGEHLPTSAPPPISRHPMPKAVMSAFTLPYREPDWGSEGPSRGPLQTDRDKATWAAACETWSNSAWKLIGGVGAWMMKGKDRPQRLDVTSLKEAFSHPSRSPLQTNRAELAWAVAYATWFAEAWCYDFALAEMSKQIEPPLDKKERWDFNWAHSAKFLGVPLQCLPLERRELFSAIGRAVYRGEMSVDRGRIEADQLLTMHDQIVDDKKTYDRERHRGGPQRDEVEAAKRKLKRKSEQTPEARWLKD